MQTDILSRQLHTLDIEEVKELRRVADTIFEPLMRPFRQKRTVQEFSFKKSIKTAQRLGAFLPSYEKVQKEHRKSRLVIAMSLAGIDRCSAVSLIPLFSCLKETSLDFNFYVYTDNLIKAEFTHDGFLANDHMIAWNHVAGPAIIERMANLETDSQEDMLLIIDSLGGGDSRWYEYWDYEHRNAVREEQDKYLSSAGKHSYYSRIRKELNGNFSRLKDLKLPPEWRRRVEHNTQERWMETPALEEYMIRWVFNPNFGTYRHGEAYIPYISAFELVPKLRSKFRQIHLLTPNNQSSHRHILDRMLKTNVIDYHHQANTIYGFATVLANIVHGQCPFDGPFTKKVSYEIVKFSEYFGDDEEDDLGEYSENAGGVGDHSNLKKIAGDCFDKLAHIEPCIPSITTLSVSNRKRGAECMEIKELPFSQLDASLILPCTFNMNRFWEEQVISSDLEIENGDSEYTRLRKAEDVIDTIKKYQIIYKKGYGYFGLNREKRPAVTEAAKLNEVLAGIEYEKHHTSTLRTNVEEFFLMLAPIYHKYLHDLSLKNVIWCSGAAYSQEARAISVNPKNPIDKRRTDCWHELGHHLESCCPPIGVFTNELITQKCGKVEKKRLVEVGKGEYAMPVTNGSQEWIKPYAGKWYKRKHSNLPSDTEVISVYSEYFTSKERLIHLIKHDFNMVRFMAFVYMGGPVMAMESLQDLKKKEALEQINQRARKNSGYTYKKGGGGRGSRGGGYKKKTNHGFGF